MLSAMNSRSGNRRSGFAGGNHHLLHRSPAEVTEILLQVYAIDSGHDKQRCAIMDLIAHRSCCVSQYKMPRPSTWSRAKLRPVPRPKRTSRTTSLVTPA